MGLFLLTQTIPNFINSLFTAILTALKPLRSYKVKHPCVPSFLTSVPTNFLSRLIDCMVLNTVFNSIPVIWQWPVYLSMLSWILSQWLSSILGENTGRAGDQTSDLLFSRLQCYRLSYGARLFSFQSHWLLFSNTNLKKKARFNKLHDYLTLSQTSPGFYVSAVKVFWKHCGKRRNCS